MRVCRNERLSQCSLGLGIRHKARTEAGHYKRRAFTRFRCRSGSHATWFFGPKPSRLINHFALRSLMSTHQSLSMSATNGVPASNGVHRSVTDNFDATLDGINQSSFDDDGERSKALLAVYALASRRETPWETVCRLVMAQVNTSELFFSIYSVESDSNVREACGWCLVESSQRPEAF